VVSISSTSSSPDVCIVSQAFSVHLTASFW